MTRNGREYHWCPHHKMWTAHHPNKCELGKKSDNKNDGPRMQLNRGLMAVDDDGADDASL